MVDNETQNNHRGLGGKTVEGLSITCSDATFQLLHHGVGKQSVSAHRTHAVIAQRKPVYHDAQRGLRNRDSLDCPLRLIHGLDRQQARRQSELLSV